MIYAQRASKCMYCQHRVNISRQYIASIYLDINTTYTIIIIWAISKNCTAPKENRNLYQMTLSKAAFRGYLTGTSMSKTSQIIHRGIIHINQ